MSDEPDDGDTIPPHLAAALAEVFDAATSPGAPDADRLLALFGDPRGISEEDALVVFSADGDPALVGVRSAGLLDETQIVAEAGDVTVVIDMSRQHDDEQVTVHIRGEVLGSDEVICVQLVAGDIEVALCVVDELGEFQFESVPLGAYDLVVAGATREVIVPIVVE